MTFASNCEMTPKNSTNLDSEMIRLYSLTSPLHGEMHKAPCEEPFIQKIEAAMGEKFDFREDFDGYAPELKDLIYVRTGGTEGLFKALGLEGYVTLLTSGESNSLAASMEILSYLHQKGQEGEILHGSPEQIASALKMSRIGTNAGARFVSTMDSVDLGGIRLGVIGKPSDWLISSNVDYAKAKARFNVDLVDIPIDELICEIKTHDIDLRSFEGSEAIYDSLKALIERYNLGGLTLRCFDLLDTIHNTGCLALARLNAEGIPSSCEGDIPALISMAYLQHATGCPGFQCNLSKVEGNDFLFAHCTVPLQMTTNYNYMTHFESGIGTAIKGELPLGEILIFKISPDLEHCVRIPGTIIRNESKPNLCRTQIVVNAPGAADYFLHMPLANHHICILRE